MRLVSMMVLTLTAISLLAISASPAWPAGFAIRNQSRLAQANAFAGATAGAEAISMMFFNPAGLVRHRGHQIEIGSAYLAPEVRFEDGSASTTLGGPIGGASSQDDVAEDGFLPSVYAMTSLSKNWRAAIGLNAPFGQATTYDDGWIGRYHALESELKTVNINPALAWRLTPSLAIGAGLNVQYIETRLTNAIDFGTIGAAAGIPGASPTTQDGEARVRGDDWSLGYNLGLLWTPKPGTRLGLAYRSGIDHEVRGRTRFTLDDAGIGEALSGGSGRFVDTGSSAETTLPATLSAGAYHDITPHLAVMAELAWTSWSDINELRIAFDNPAESDNVTELNFKDSVFAALGVTFRPSAAWTFRTGLAFDQGVTRTRFRTPRLPGGDRYWLAAGLTHTPRPWLSLNLAGTRIFTETNDIALTTEGTGNQFRGNLRGAVGSDIYTLSVGVAVRF